MTDIISGVYEIRNTQNGYRYIGGSVDITKRFRVHKRTLNNKIHSNEHLQRAWNRFGEQLFLFRILLYCDPEMVRHYEQICLDSLSHQYNIAVDAIAPQRGRHRSEDEKLRISQTTRGKIFSEETKSRLSMAMKGNTNMAGHKHTEETKQKMSKSAQSNKRNIGNKLSDETKRKIGNANRGRIMSEAFCQRMSQIRKEWWDKKRLAGA